MKFIRQEKIITTNTNIKRVDYRIYIFHVET